MAIFPATKRASLSSLHCCLCLCRCVVLHMSCPHAENMTCHTCDITPGDARKKTKIFSFFLRKIT